MAAAPAAVPAGRWWRRPGVRHVLGRLGQGLLTLWAAYTVTFFILYALPGDAVSLLVGDDATSSLTAEQLAAVSAEYGLDKPVPVQYLLAVGAALTGDLGTSFATGRPVVGMVAEALPSTLQIAGAGLVLALVLGTGLAVAATYTRWRPLARALEALPPLGVSVPSFWLGLTLLQVLSFRVPLFPAMGATGLPGVVLPAVTLAVPTSAVLAQVLGKALRSALAQPYVDTARSRGASRLRVHLRHALRNAALPTLTMAGLLVGGLLGGAVVTETVFSRPGLGRLTATAVGARDVPTVLGVVLLAATVFVLVNLVVDLLYPALDPRVADTPRRARRRRDRLAAGQPGLAVGRG